MPEETFHENLFAALVAANYHAAKTSMRYGGDWADRVKWMEGRQSPVFTKIPKLGHAKALLDRMGRPTPSARHTLLTHAHAAVDRARVLTHSPRRWSGAHRSDGEGDQRGESRPDSILFGCSKNSR